MEESDDLFSGDGGALSGSSLCVCAATSRTGSWSRDVGGECGTPACCRLFLSNTLSLLHSLALSFSLCTLSLSLLQILSCKGPAPSSSLPSSHYTTAKQKQRLPFPRHPPPILPNNRAPRLGVQRAGRRRTRKGNKHEGCVWGVPITFHFRANLHRLRQDEGGRNVECQWT